MCLVIAARLSMGMALFALKSAKDLFRKPCPGPEASASFYWRRRSSERESFGLEILVGQWLQLKVN